MTILVNEVLSKPYYLYYYVCYYYVVYMTFPIADPFITIPVVLKESLKVSFLMRKGAGHLFLLGKL